MSYINTYVLISNIPTHTKNQLFQADALDLDLTVDETITRASTTESYNQLRALMAQFMFKGDAIFKKARAAGMVCLLCAAHSIRYTRMMMVLAVLLAGSSVCLCVHTL